MGRMPILDQASQRALGSRMAELAAPLPRDQRLLLYLAGFFGEAKRQGLNASQMIEYVARIVRIHERGMLPVSIVLEDSKCPTCGGLL